MLKTQPPYLRIQPYVEIGSLQTSLVQMRPTGVGWAPNPVRLAFLQKGEIWTHRQTHTKGECGDDGKDQNDASINIKKYLPPCSSRILPCLQSKGGTYAPPLESGFVTCL